MSKKKVLVTGSCGFIFSNFIIKALKEESDDFEFISVDKLIAPYNHYNINKEHRFYLGDIADEHFMDGLFKIEKPDIIVHGAAESFVDDSIRKALPFVHSNVLGTQIMVDMALKYGTERFIYISTDEVYGQLKNINDPSWTEDTPINPRNPYSASKAAGELIVLAAHQTHGLPFNITRSCNNYGPRQPPRNLVPKIITCVVANKKIPIHGNGANYREWIYVDDHCSAIFTIMKKAPLNEIYNIGSGIEYTNLEMVKNICKVFEKGENLVEFIRDRPGHDFRYSVDCSKLKKLGWNITDPPNYRIRSTVNWYLENIKLYV